MITQGFEVKSQLPAAGLNVSIMFILEGHKDETFSLCPKGKKKLSKCQSFFLKFH